MPNDERILETMPDGALGLIPLKSCEELGAKVDQYLVGWREKREHAHKNEAAFKGYHRDSYIISTSVPRFGTGEAKGVIKESVRGYDLYLMVDVTNYSLTYSVSGHENHMSPDDHYADLKRIIAAVGGKARRITAIIPFLYESRQHKRTARESLDCALALQELTAMGVDNIITFDAHDPRVQNAIPLKGFETVQPAYQFIKGILKNCDDLKLDNDHLMIISPDEGGTNRAVYLANVLGVDMGMFYKRRDYSKIVDGRNPIVAHEFLGTSVEGKDVIIIDDMISSGESMIDVATELKKRKANRIFVVSTFGLFTNGLERFDKAVEDGTIYKVVTTNLTYQTPELLSRPYYINCDMSKYIAYIIDTLNHDSSISDLLNPYDRIQKLVSKYKKNINNIVSRGTVPYSFSETHKKGIARCNSFLCL
ncbi:MAG: ribose-phosphate pyrophosphokinase [Roseburia inulinivorans]